MDFGLNPEESSTDLLFVVCARCGEERPKSAFTAKRQSAGQTKQCIDCRNQRVSHVSSAFLVYKTLNPHQMKHSRSKVVLQTLRNIALRPSSPGRPATKRTDGDAGLSPPNERSGTQPTSPEKLRQLHTARSLFGEPISQPQVVLGTPIPPTQQSLRNFRTLAPSPTVQPTTNQIAFHKGGKDSQDDASKAEAKARQVAIQRDHRSRRRAGETVSLTPSISQLGVSAVTDEPGGADRLGRPVVQIKVNNVGPDSHMHWRPSDADIQPLAASWLCNGARGTVYDIGWAPGADPIQDSPCVIMMEFDKYNGPVFLTTPDGKKIVPILSVERDFLIGATFCARTQFPLIVCYAITVHKSQSITEDMIVTDLSCQDFQTGLSYVAVSRVETLEGLMLEAPFDRNHLVYGSPPDGMKMKMRDQELRKRQVLTQNPYMSHNTKNCHGNRSLSRIGTIALMTKTQVGLGVLAIPRTFHALGLIPGVFCLVAIGDWVFISASAMLGISVGLNAVSSHALCTWTFVIIAAVSTFLLASIRTLSKIGWIAWVGVVCIMTAIFSVTIAVGVENKTPVAIEGNSTTFRLTNDPPFADAMAAVSSHIFAYAGTPAYFSIIAEMRDPTLYTSALIWSQSIMTAVYVVIGVVIYYYVGSEVASPALASAGPTMKKVGFGFALPGLLVSAMIVTHLPAKYIFLRILRGSEHLHRSSFIHWGTWLGCTGGVTIIAYIIASAIPMFDPLVSLVGASFGVFLCFQPFGCMWLHDNWGCRKRGLRWKGGLAWSIFIIIIGTFLMIGGTYGSIEGLLFATRDGFGAAWGCEDNSITVPSNSTASASSTITNSTTTP
ncbi:hypothetical protein FOMA001_g2660 [Fusarium oxysporum f. sp. matthiolae]|nr:hypothetical protein FOMA001_g2660 [Fusarium oxysporum f. sp. matthiolae]